jgi:hypothetical protein
MLFCVQIVQTNNNECSWKDFFLFFPSVANKKKCKFVKKAENLNYKV